MFFLKRLLVISAFTAFALPSFALDCSNLNGTFEIDPGILDKTLTLTFSKEELRLKTFRTVRKFDLISNKYYSKSGSSRSRLEQCQDYSGSNAYCATYADRVQTLIEDAKEKLVATGKRNSVGYALLTCFNKRVDEFIGR